MSTITILSIETSCDETSIAISESSNNTIKILSNIVSSQVKLHAAWGGVVPNLAAREHVKNIPKILDDALSASNKKLSDVDIISVVNGPGLIPALLVGLNFAKTLAYKLNKPLLGIHHIEGHIYSNFVGGISNDEFLISKQTSIQNSKSYQIEFPILCLVVSGGHTQLVLMKDHFEYEIVGQTLDDAVGEAFDKVARILDIGYPGGPAVAEHAKKFQMASDEKFKIKFPRPMIYSDNFDFSFSGLKTAVLYETKKNIDLIKNESYISSICREFQNAAVDVLTTKTIKAAKMFHPKTIMLAGGVSANTELRIKLGEEVNKNLPPIVYCIPPMDLTGDNAAMIAIATHFRYNRMTTQEKELAKDSWSSLQADANLKLN